MPASAKAGLMFRDSVSSSAYNVFLAAHEWSGAKRVEMQWRENHWGSDYTPNPGPTWVSGIWLKLVRQVNANPATSTFTGYTSADGITWTLFHTKVIAMGSTAQVGLAVSAENNTKLVTAVFDNVVADTNLQDITITTVPSGAKFTIDGGAAEFGSGSVFRWVPGSTHTIGAAAAVGGTRYVFANWSGGGSGTNPTITTPGVATSYTANFTTEYLLTTAVSPAGAGTVAPAGGYFASGTQMQLSASPTTGYAFSGWSGDASGTGSVTLTMTGPKNVTATFSAAAITHTITGVPAGVLVYVDPVLANKECWTPCTRQWLPGSPHNLVAQPYGGYTFNQWTSGGPLPGGVPACAQGQADCWVAPQSATTFYANYTAGSAYSLTTSATAGGSIVPSPGTQTYASPTLVTITATPLANYVFTGFSGSINTTANSSTPVSYSLMVDGVKNVTANFTQAFSSGYVNPPARVAPVISSTAVPGLPVVTPSSPGAPSFDPPSSIVINKTTINSNPALPPGIVKNNSVIFNVSNVSIRAGVTVEVREFDYVVFNTAGTVSVNGNLKSDGTRVAFIGTGDYTIPGDAAPSGGILQAVGGDGGHGLSQVLLPFPASTLSRASSTEEVAAMGVHPRVPPGSMAKAAVDLAEMELLGGQMQGTKGRKGKDPTTVPDSRGGQRRGPISATLLTSCS